MCICTVSIYHNLQEIKLIVISVSSLSSTKVLSTMNAPLKMKVTFGAPLKLMAMECTMVIITLDGAAQPVKKLR